MDFHIVKGVEECPATATRGALACDSEAVRLWKVDGAGVEVDRPLPGSATGYACPRTGVGAAIPCGYADPGVEVASGLE